MLQQTRVPTVVERYPVFLREFPCVEALAAAGPGRVCEAWAGLGYYTRALNLHRAAVTIMAEHAGRLPSTAAELTGLAGIGRYTAGAVASIAYGEQVPVVDGNVVRVLCRVFAIGSAPDKNSTKSRLWALAEQLVRGEGPGDFNQAIMEHGALVCTPLGPRCPACPIRAECAACARGDPTRWPAKTKAPTVKRLDVAFVYLRDGRGVWLTRRPLSGLWAGLWELPSAQGPHARAELSARLRLQLGRPVGLVRHALTHRLVTARIYAPHPVARLRTGQGLRRFSDPLTAPLTGLARKAIVAAAKGDRTTTPEIAIMKGRRY